MLRDILPTCAFSQSLKQSIRDISRVHDEVVRDMLTKLKEFDEASWFLQNDDAFAL